MTDPEDLDDGVFVPFVAMASNGGPYPDDAFIAGHEMGRLESDLYHARNSGHRPSARWIRATLERQADLVSMALDFVMVVKPPGPDDDQNAVWVSFQ